MNTTIEKSFMPFCKNRSGRKIKKLKAILVHYTANYSTGANDLMHKKYFTDTDRYASSQFVVDSERILQLMPINEVAWHGGGSRYTKWANSIREGISINYFTVGIELCVNKDGRYTETEKNGAYLVAVLLIDNKLTIDDVYRHYDATGKSCPIQYLKEESWTRFKELVTAYINMIKKGFINHDNIDRVDKYIKVTANLNGRKGPSTKFDIVKNYPKDTIVNIDDYIDGWYMTNEGTWISSHYCEDINIDKTKNSLKTVKLNNPTISRMGPSDVYDVYETIPANTVVNLGEFFNGFYNIGSERYIKASNNWTVINHTDIIEPDPIIENKILGKGVIDIVKLNIRQKPSIGSSILGTYDKGDVVDILSTTGEWVQTKLGWIHGFYVKETYSRELVEVSVNLEVKKDHYKKSDTVMTLKPGHKTVVLETKKVGKDHWVHLKEGWVQTSIYNTMINTNKTI